MTSVPIVLILGAGPRIGTAVATQFANDGYRVAVASRKGSRIIEDCSAYVADFSRPESLIELFDSVIKDLGGVPTVVIYNAAAMTLPADPTNILSIPVEKVTADLIVNTVSAYTAAQQAVRVWQHLPETTKKTFIFTGNMQNVAILPIPAMLNIGIGKSATAHWIGAADNAMKQTNRRFFYADERTEAGMLKGMSLDGPAHAEFYKTLSEQPALPWHVTFVKNKGYQKF